MKKRLIYQSVVFVVAFLIVSLGFINYDQEKRLLSKLLASETVVKEEKVEPADEEQQEPVIEPVPPEVDQEESKPIKIIFAGDLLMESSIAQTVEEHGLDYPFLEVSEEINQADLAVVNLETAVTEETDSYDKQYAFKMPPAYVQAIKNAGFDIVSLANNHTMDYHEAGLVDTIDHLQAAEIATIGAGKTIDEAYAPHSVEVGGKTVAFLAFSRVLPAVSWYAGADKPGIASGYQLERMEDIIREQKNNHDYVLVYIHWGIERQRKPEPYQMNDAKALIDAGADAIVGAHPHVLQGFQYYNDKPIAYSLGNFLFPNYVSGQTAETGLLTVTLDEDDVGISFSPYLIENDQIHRLIGSEKERILNELVELSVDVGRQDQQFFKQ